MPPSPPLLDTRTIDDIMAGLKKQAQADLPNWVQSPTDDPGVMLQRIFARLLEITLQRLNHVPDKNLLAFLDAMGVESSAAVARAGAGHLHASSECRADVRRARRAGRH